MLELEEKSLAHYAIQRRLARGGMSEVYLASDKRTQQLIAIKVVNRSEDNYFVRFQREIKTLSTLSHKHILPIIEFGEHGSWHYCVMPYIEHGTLRDRITKGPLTQEEAGEVLVQIASALQFAHNHGILHRDIKPSNILLKDEQHIYLADFGLAKNVRESSSVTQTGCLIGTPEYMAPELAEVPASTHSDIYAVGVVLYEMLTRQVPFKGTTPLSIYWKHIKDTPKPPSQLNPAISQPIEQVVLQALEKDPRRRFQTVQALARAYMQALHSPDETLAMPEAELPEALKGIRLSPPTQRVIPAPASAPQPRHMHPALATLIAALFLILIPFVLSFSTYKNDAPLTLGASVHFAKQVGTLHELPALPKSVPHPTPTPAPKSSGQNKANSGNSDQGHQAGGQGGNGHGHKHGHGHGHGD